MILKNLKIKLIISTITIFLVYLFFVSHCFAQQEKYINFLEQTLKDSYIAMESIVNDKTGFPYDVVDSKTLEVVDSKTSPTEIGEWITSIVIARDLNFIDKYEAHNKMVRVLDTLERIEKHRGFLFQWYDAKTGKAISPLVPSIDNLNFDACLIVAAAAFRQDSPLIYRRIKNMLDKKDYSFFHKRSNSNLDWLNHGYYINHSSYSHYDYGHFFSEIGLAIIPIMQGEIPIESLSSTQVPVRKCNLLKDYNMVGISWDGSLFNSFYPYLFLGYEILPEPIKENLRKHVRIHIKKAEKLNLPFWGWSPAWGTRGDDYVSWGVAELADWGAGHGVTGAMSAKGYNPESPEVTPYSSFLVIGSMSPEEELFSEAMDNLINIKNSGYGYNCHGFYDSLDVKLEKPGKYKVSLDEGMNIIGAYNALRRIKGQKGIEAYFWEYFNQQDYNLTKQVFKRISDKRFKNIMTAKSHNEKDLLCQNRLVSIDNHMIDKGGWGFGTARCVSKNVILEDKGRVWNLKYRIMNDFGGGYIRLRNLDELKNYNYLVFKAKIDKGDTTRGFQIELKERGTVFPPVFKYSVTDLPSDRWQKFIIPLNTITNDKINVIPSELTIVFDRNTSGSIEGSVYIADLALHKR